jgi:hypothetical protein
MRVWKLEKDKDVKDMSVKRLVLGKNELGYIVALGEHTTTFGTIDDVKGVSHCEYAEEL